MTKSGASTIPPRPQNSRGYLPYAHRQANFDKPALTISLQPSRTGGDGGGRCKDTHATGASECPRLNKEMDGEGIQGIFEARLAILPCLSFKKEIDMQGIKHVLSILGSRFEVACGRCRHALDLALQLRFSFEVGASRFGLMSASPE